MDKFREQQSKVSDSKSFESKPTPPMGGGMGYRSPIASVTPPAAAPENADENTVKALNPNNIYYIENSLGFSVIHTRSGKTTVKLTLSEISAILPSDRFVMTHPSYLVNAIAIEGVAEQSVLVNGTEIPVNPDRKRILVEVLNRI
jgi:hypothetical protein